MDYKKLITIDPSKRSWKPCIRGMRISVYDILKMLASWMSYNDIISDFPELTLDDIKASLAFASDREHFITSFTNEATIWSKHFA